MSSRTYKNCTIYAYSRLVSEFNQTLQLASQNKSKYLLLYPGSNQLNLFQTIRNFLYSQHKTRSFIKIGDVLFVNVKVVIRYGTFGQDTDRALWSWLREKAISEGHQCQELQSSDIVVFKNKAKNKNDKSRTSRPQDREKKFRKTKRQHRDVGGYGS